ncbi:Membrane protein YdfJ [Corynebacterium urogenitale]|uniref:Membrane protein YdfJ n=1 Tax=Corynebacterium urogenitale TaxID=2487892 RepID=A0A5J6ZBW5_9CORY|nr:MMPL family transporter [Corynebacterium urogenitale]QFQ02859.1 Membrane protein YdfJ [Corynebacterium urogenitale]
MATLLYRIGRSAYLHRWRFIAVWLLLIVGMGTAAATMSTTTSMNFSIPGLESVETQEKIKERFPGDSGDQIEAPTGKVVIKAPDGSTLADPGVDKEVQQLTAALKDVEGLTDTEALVPPAMAAQGLQKQMVPALKAQGIPQEQIDANIRAISPLSEDKTTGTLDVTFDAPTNMDIPAEYIEDFEQTVEENKGSLDVAWSGNAFQMSEISGTAELIGLAVAALVLIVTFGSFVAAGLPLLSAVVGLGIGIAGVFAATAFTDTISTMTPTLASMIGLAVGIDYALFILARFRNELVAHAGASDMEPKELADELKKIPREERGHLAGLAVGKAGSAVVFAGLTVLIALAALSIINIPFLTAMALAAACTVAIAVIVAVTLLPAILGAFGTKVFAGRAPIVKAPDPENDTPTMGLKWVRQVRKHPVVYMLGTAVVLILLAIPALNLRLAMPTDGTMAQDSPNRIAYEMTNDAFGEGRNAPMLALVDYKDLSAKEKPAAIQEALKTFQSTEGVVNAQVVTTNGNPKDPRDMGDAAQVLITPEFGATDERAADLLASVRAGEEGFSSATGANYSITGVSPMYEDISQRLSDVLLPYVGIVLLLAFLLLMLVFRSIWVPLIAAVGFGLSVAATFGVTVALWQEGALGIIDDPQPLISFLPIMLIGIVFGLAMDYQVFLVTRMREGWAHGKTPGNAVANGFKHGARVVTAAALIMISVFAAFILMDEPFIKVMGFALAVAVFFDAFIVRMTFIPAVMFLLDAKAWAIPKWLDKAIPSVDVEGEKLRSTSISTPSSEASATAAATSATGASSADQEAR